MSKENAKKQASNITELIIQGIVVRLVFSESANTAAPEMIREILKSSYLQHVAN